MSETLSEPLAVFSYFLCSFLFSLYFNCKGSNFFSNTYSIKCLKIALKTWEDL